MKRRLPSDKRLNWRDENMPVLRMARKSDKEQFTLQEIKPSDVEAWHKYKMNNSVTIEPHWKNDPTYFLKNKKKKRK